MTIPVIIARKKGDIISECFKLLNKLQREADNEKQEKKNIDQASLVENTSNDGEFLVVTNCKPNKEWILDLGCTFHLCSNRTSFQHTKLYLKVRNKSSCKIAKFGIVRIKMYDGVVKTLTDVRHIQVIHLR